MTDNAHLFVDTSSNDPPRSLRQHWKAGYWLTCLKATQGTSYIWKAAKRLARLWHRLGGVVIHYHFLMPGTVASGAAQARFFFSVVSTYLKPGDVLCVDVETNGETGAEHAAFVAELARLAPGYEMWTYCGAYFARDNKIQPHGTRLWLPGYPTFPFIPPGWTKATLVAHQNTDAATGVPGMPAKVDQSVLLWPLLHATPPTPRPPAKPHHKPTSGPWYHRWMRWIRYYHHK